MERKLHQNRGLISGGIAAGRSFFHGKGPDGLDQFSDLPS